MKSKVIGLDNKAAGDIELADEVFGAEVRRDLLARMVNYQLANSVPGRIRRKACMRCAAPQPSRGVRRGPVARGRVLCAHRIGVVAAQCSVR